MLSRPGLAHTDAYIEKSKRVAESRLTLAAPTSHLGIVVMFSCFTTNADASQTQHKQDPNDKPEDLPTSKLLVADMAALAKTSMDCYLLSIPGELRDRIYRFCEVDYVPLSVYDKPLHRPNFLSLTQACRQIRHEFRPLYMAHTLIELSADAQSPVANLVPIFYPLAEPHIMAAYRGNLQIVVDVYCNHACFLLDSLLSLLITSPEVKFRFTTHESFPLAHPAVTQINEFLSHTANPKNVVWRELFKSIKSVLMEFSDYGHSLMFRMNRQMACEAHSWWAEAELPTMAVFKIKFRWSEEDGFRSGFVRWDVLDRDYGSD